MNKIQLVLFDLGNVLVRFTPDSFWQELGLAGPQRDIFFDDVKQATIEFECGRIHTSKYFDRLEQVFDGRFRREHIRRAVASVLTDPIAGMESLVARVTQRCHTALVSNTNEFHYQYCMRAVPALKMLPRHYVSYRLGAMKPHRVFYEQVIENAQKKPNVTLFIDDVIENINGAKKLGMSTFHFTSPSELEKQLISVGVL